MRFVLLSRVMIFVVVAVVLPSTWAIHGPGSATTTPKTTATTTTTTTTTTSSAVFGVSQRFVVWTQIRGGAVEEPGSAEDVDAIILRAASEGKLVVIDFSATWCGPCKMIAPLFKELSEGFTDVVFVKVDVDDNPDTAAKYNVSAMPTFIFLKQGEVIDRLMGASPSRLQELIEEHK